MPSTSAGFRIPTRDIRATSRPTAQRRLASTTPGRSGAGRIEGSICSGSPGKSTAGLHVKPMRLMRSGSRATAAWTIPFASIAFVRARCSCSTSARWRPARWSLPASRAVDWLGCGLKSGPSFRSTAGRSRLRPSSARTSGSCRSPSSAAPGRTSRCAAP